MFSGAISRVRGKSTELQLPLLLFSTVFMSILALIIDKTFLFVFLVTLAGLFASEIVQEIWVRNKKQIPGVKDYGRMDLLSFEIRLRIACFLSIVFFMTSLFFVSRGLTERIQYLVVLNAIAVIIFSMIKIPRITSGKYAKSQMTRYIEEVLESRFQTLKYTDVQGALHISLFVLILGLLLLFRENLVGAIISLLFIQLTAYFYIVNLGSIESRYKWLSKKVGNIGEERLQRMLDKKITHYRYSRYLILAGLIIFLAIVWLPSFVWLSFAFGILITISLLVTAILIERERRKVDRYSGELPFFEEFPNLLLIGSGVSFSIIGIGIVLQSTQEVFGSLESLFLRLAVTMFIVLLIFIERIIAKYSFNTNRENEVRGLLDYMYKTKSYQSLVELITANEESTRSYVASLILKIPPNDDYEAMVSVCAKASNVYTIYISDVWRILLKKELNEKSEKLVFNFAMNHVLSLDPIIRDSAMQLIKRYAEGFDKQKLRQILEFLENNKDVTNQEREIVFEIINVLVRRKDSFGKAAAKLMVNHLKVDDWKARYRAYKIVKIVVNTHPEVLSLMLPVFLTILQDGQDDEATKYAIEGISIISEGIQSLDSDQMKILEKQITQNKLIPILEKSLLLVVITKFGGGRKKEIEKIIGELIEDRREETRKNIGKVILNYIARHPKYELTTLEISVIKTMLSEETFTVRKYGLAVLKAIQENYEFKDCKEWIYQLLQELVEIQIIDVQERVVQLIMLFSSESQEILQLGKNNLKTWLKTGDSRLLYQLIGLIGTFINKGEMSINQCMGLYEQLIYTQDSINLRMLEVIDENYQNVFYLDKVAIVEFMQKILTNSVTEEIAGQMTKLVEKINPEGRWNKGDESEREGKGKRMEDAILLLFQKLLATRNEKIQRIAVNYISQDDQKRELLGRLREKSLEEVWETTEKGKLALLSIRSILKFFTPRDTDLISLIYDALLSKDREKVEDAHSIIVELVAIQDLTENITKELLHRIVQEWFYWSVERQDDILTLIVQIAERIKSVKKGVTDKEKERKDQLNKSLEQLSTQIVTLLDAIKTDDKAKEKLIIVYEFLQSPVLKWENYVEDRLPKEEEEEEEIISGVTATNQRQVSRERHKDMGHSAGKQQSGYSGEIENKMAKYFGSEALSEDFQEEGEEEEENEKDASLLDQLLEKQGADYYVEEVPKEDTIYIFDEEMDDKFLRDKNQKKNEKKKNEEIDED